MKGLERDWEKRHIQSIKVTDKLIGKTFDKTAPEIGAILAGINFSSDDFSFRKFPNAKRRILKVIGKMNSKLSQLTVDGIVKSWGLANQKYDGLVRQYLANIYLDRQVRNNFFQVNAPALFAFIDRKVDGLKLSDRVWKATQPVMDELETYLGAGIGEGKSAAELSRDVRQLLKDPDTLFRRVRDKNGKLVLSKAAKAYHPGRGMYRSAYKNAMRLSRTEINMAFRVADYERRKQLPFVTGITVHLSAAHPEIDICDEMQGDYPKGFKFTGWHPHCFCYTTAKLLPKQEFAKLLQGKPANVNYYRVFPPKKAQEYLEKNARKLYSLKTTPYFLQQNFVSKNGKIQLKSEILPTLVKIKGQVKSQLRKAQQYKIIDDYFKATSEFGAEVNSHAASSELRSALLSYTGSDYRVLNRYLRHGAEYLKKTWGNEFKIAYKAVDDGLMKCFAETSIRTKGYKKTQTLYRGIRRNRHSEHLWNLKEGDVFVEKGYMSTSVDERVAKEFLDTSAADGPAGLPSEGGILFKIRTKNGGLPIRSISSVKSENEVLLNKSTKFKVVSVRDSGELRKIELEEL